MTWKVIGQSVIGQSHISSGKGCEDALKYSVCMTSSGDEVLSCFMSDGAGSAKFAARASEKSVSMSLDFVETKIAAGIEITTNILWELAESIYDSLVQSADHENVPKNEFSCTLLGFVAYPSFSFFIQVGDGAIVVSDETGHLIPVWWPQNGEYQNSTAFLIDNANLSNLKIKIIEQPIKEIGIFTDGLQNLALKNDSEEVHQPFFENLFMWLRKASDPDHISILNSKLTDYLSGDVINSRTDDDKSLFLATKA